MRPGCTSRSIDDPPVLHLRIALDADSAPARIDTCATAFGDHVARCVVRPLATGTYDMVTADGRLLDVLEMTTLSAGLGFERRCTPTAR